MYIITFLPCGTQFLVNQENEDIAFKSAVKANELVGLDGVYFIEMLTDQYGEAEEYYKLFAFLKKTIEDNHFDFGLRMKEIYGK